MSQSLEEHQMLYQLKDRFERVESDSLSQPVCPPGKYLCFRLDGVKASKQHLKDRLVNERFRDAFSRAIMTTYYIFRRQSEKVNKNFYLCAVALSDEVSFILNNKENYHKNRPFKIGTMLTGALSAAMTLEYQSGGGQQGRNKQRQELVTFDARPLFLNSYDDVEDYIRFRWLIGRRNAMCKTLRVEGIFSGTDIYETTLKNDVPRLTQEIENHGLAGKLRTALSDFRIFIPDEKGDLHGHAPSTLERGVEAQFQHLRTFHRWLEQ